MIARVAVWEPMPDDDRQWVIDAAKTVPGVLDGYHLVDPITGNGLSIAFFDDDVNVDEVKTAIASASRADEIRLERRPASGTEVRDDLQGHQTGIGTAASRHAPRERGDPRRILLAPPFCRRRLRP